MRATVKILVTLWCSLVYPGVFPTIAAVAHFIAWRILHHDYLYTSMQIWIASGLVLIAVRKRKRS